MGPDRGRCQLICLGLRLSRKAGQRRTTGRKARLLAEVRGLQHGPWAVAPGAGRTRLPRTQCALRSSVHVLKPTLHFVGGCWAARRRVGASELLEAVNGIRRVRHTWKVLYNRGRGLMLSCIHLGPRPSSAASLPQFPIYRSLVGLPRGVNEVTYAPNAQKWPQHTVGVQDMSLDT